MDERGKEEDEGKEEERGKEEHGGKEEAGNEGNEEEKRRGRRRWIPSSRGQEHRKGPNSSIMKMMIWFENSEFLSEWRLNLEK